MARNEPEIIWLGTIKNGIKNYYRQGKYAEYLKQLEGKEFEEILRLKSEPVTFDQHGYMRAGIIRKTCMQTDLFEGWDEEEIYNFFATQFFTVTFIKTLGSGESVEVKKRLSMATCGKKRASEFIESVLRYLSSNGIYPLSPDEYFNGLYSSIDRNEQGKNKKN